MFRFSPPQILHTEWGGNAVLRLPEIKHHKIIVLSDLHFPRSDSHPKYLYEFLLHNTCDTLIFAGDTHEGYDPELGDFGEMHKRVWDLIADRKQQGMRVIDLPGNHDIYKRRDDIIGHKAFGTEYWNDVIVQSDLGPTLLFHGDILDGKIAKRYDKLAYKVATKIAVGDRSLLDVLSAIEKLSDKLTGDRPKKTNSVKMEFAAATMAIERGCNAVGIGHTHKASHFLPVKKQPDILFGNTGSWVGMDTPMATAMTLSHDGHWDLVNWNKQRKKFFDEKPAGIAAPHPQSVFREATMAEFEWQKALHSVYIQEVLIQKTTESLERVEKIKNRVQEYMKSAEEKLHEAKAEVAKIAPNAKIVRLEKPAVHHPVLDMA